MDILYLAILCSHWVPTRFPRGNLEFPMFSTRYHLEIQTTGGNHVETGAWQMETWGNHVETRWKPCVNWGLIEGNLRKSFCKVSNYENFIFQLYNFQLNVCLFLKCFQKFEQFAVHITKYKTFVNSLCTPCKSRNSSILIFVETHFDPRKECFQGKIKWQILLAHFVNYCML